MGKLGANVLIVYFLDDNIPCLPAGRHCSNTPILRSFYSMTAERGTISIPFSFILGIISLRDLSVEG